MHSLAAAALLGLALACSSSGGDGTGNPGGGGPVCPTTFTNPIAPGADPWVVKSQGHYFLVESRDNAIWVYRSDTLTSPKRNGVVVWRPTSGGWNQQDIWAPELHQVNGKWYIYYAAGMPGPSAPDAEFTDQRAGVLEAVGDDPQGQYVDRGQLYTGNDVAGKTDDIWAIDLTVGTIGGQLYAVWSGWTQNMPTHVTPQQLYIARMSDPTTIATSRVLLSAPTESWEKGTQLDLQEGPEFLQHGNDTFIVYSTRESFLPDYRLGSLRLTSGADPLDPKSWTKSAGPVFLGNPSGGAYGVGHASFTQSPDGAEDWIVYHAKTVSAAGWDDRMIRMQKFGWNADGTPAFGTPTAAGAPVPVPSGQCK